MAFLNLLRLNRLMGATLRERKLAKIAAAASAQAESSVDDNEDSNELEITVELDDVHTAGEYVVEVSPESVEDADIELTVSDRRKRHEEIRQRIKQRRRGQMADNSCIYCKDVGRPCCWGRFGSLASNTRAWPLGYGPTRTPSARSCLRGNFCKN